MKNEKKPNILVAQPSLPPLEDFVSYLQQIWESKILSNCGPLHQQLEEQLARHLDVPYVSLFNNGTIALLVALKALDLRGEVITTPFSFIATANAIRWAGLTPVFCDIDPVSLNIDSKSLAMHITDHTCAILPVHCFGRPCDVDAIADTASQHGLAVIYDAAHAFGVKLEGRSILQHGDLSVLSFHATKVFNTFEGGAIISHDTTMKKRIDQLRNFGIVDEETLADAGINGKMHELSAAMGLLQLNHLADNVARRAELSANYNKQLAGITGLAALPSIPASTDNYSYFPILVEPDYPLSRDALHAHLKSEGILARRYFYPLIPDLYRSADIPVHGSATPVAERVAAQILCLPMHANLTDDDQNAIIAALSSPCGSAP